MRTSFFLLTAVCVLDTSPMKALERLEPAQGCYFGFTLDSGAPISDLSSTLGFTPAVYVRFFDFSTVSTDLESIPSFLKEVSSVQGIAMLTMEPWAGLEAVTEPQCQQLADFCATAERQGIGGIFIWFGHEMNGNWYPWGQRPTSFKTKFRLLAKIVHEQTSRTAMMWAANYGLGYPFGKAIPLAGTADFVVLDTNRDGQITDRDDMYEPYYPGNDAVDWVGLTLYHWGITYPWLENEIPPTNSLVHSMTGTYQGTTPNFYARYSLNAARKKPMAIAETAAFYNTEMPGPSELRIKQTWWRQILAARSQFPMLKCVNWFNEFKREPAAQNNLIDWRISATPLIRDAFVSELRAAGLGTAFLTANETELLVPYYIAVNYAARGSAHPTITWDSHIGRLYQLYSTDDFTNWTPASEAIPGTGAPISVAPLENPTSQRAMYRLQISRP